MFVADPVGVAFVVGDSDCELLDVGSADVLKLLVVVADSLLPENSALID